MNKAHWAHQTPESTKNSESLNVAAEVQNHQDEYQVLQRCPDIGGIVRARLVVLSEFVRK